MPEIGTSSSMSGDGKRSVGHRPQTTAPVLDSTFASWPFASFRLGATIRSLLGQADIGRDAEGDLVQSPLAFGNLMHQTVEGFCGRGR
jgi:hypothetical protein